MKGKGEYHEYLNSINKLKVIQRLTIKPCYYELLREETKIQRGGLRKILNYFIDKKAIIPHRYNSIVKATFGNDDTIIKNGLEYFILDLDNEDSLMYLTDIDLNDTIKYIQHNSQNNYAKRVHEYMKRFPEKARLTRYNFKDMNWLMQIIKVTENTDSSFSPLLYSKELTQEIIEEGKKQLDHTIEKLKIENPEAYANYLKLMENLETDMTFNKLTNNLKESFAEKESQDEAEGKKIKYLLQHFINLGHSKYDLLIFLSWSSPSRENYKRYWDIIKNNDN